MKQAILKFLERQWSNPTKRVWIIRIAIFSSQALLILGVAIFMWLHFATSTY